MAALLQSRMTLGEKPAGDVWQALNPISKLVWIGEVLDESLVVPKQPGIHPAPHGRARQPSSLRAVLVGFEVGIREELFCRKTLLRRVAVRADSTTMGAPQA